MSVSVTSPVSSLKLKVCMVVNTGFYTIVITMLISNGIHVIPSMGDTLIILL